MAVNGADVVATSKVTLAFYLLSLTLKLKVCARASGDLTGLGGLTGQRPKGNRM